MIEAAGIIPISQKDVAGIPDMALSIPDFEGQAIFRIFSNSTQTEIGCFAAQITNSYSFQQKIFVGPILGVFTFAAALASFATAISGDDIVETRNHYAHSPSVMAVFAVWHHIYYSGALSMNWPSVLVAFWSNFAWAGGMIYFEEMQNTINDLAGLNKRNISHVGAAGTEGRTPDIGGGFDVHAVYKEHNALNTTGLPRGFFKRDDSASATRGFHFTGQPVKPGLPLPGNFSGFAGTLAQEHIPASNAFMTGFLWFLTLLAFVVTSVLAFKIVIEGLSNMKMIKRERFKLFRQNYFRYMTAAVLRTFFIGFFMISFLCMFQFTYYNALGPDGIIAASVAFPLVLFAIGIAAALAFLCQVTGGQYTVGRDRLDIQKRWIFGFFPWYTCALRSKHPQSEDVIHAGSIPCWVLKWSWCLKPTHQSKNYIKTYGWLACRYRRTRWWFFAIWLIYEFVRASFLAGASHRPLAQAVGLLVVETLTFIGMVYLHPFESLRLNILLVYLLGFSKIATTALSIALDVRFNISRMTVTVIGIVIIVNQGLLTIAVLAMIVVGVISSYMSVTRSRDIVPREGRMSLRGKYFERIRFKARDVPRLRSTQNETALEPVRGPSFRVKQVKRIPKIENEDHEFMMELRNSSSTELWITERSDDEAGKQSQRVRAASNRSGSSYTALPAAARLHRPSWTLNDFRRLRELETSRDWSDSLSSGTTDWPICRDTMSFRPNLITTPERRIAGIATPVSRQSSIRLVTDTEDAEIQRPPIPRKSSKRQQAHPTDATK